MSPSTLGLLCRLARMVRTPRLRTMQEFAEQEIIIPTGPYAGRRYSVARNPFAACWFHEVDFGGWRRNVGTGPVQSGKTLQCFVIPTMYHLFEVGETVICGLPNLDQVEDKWKQDLKPAIKASRYHDLLPTRGPGSKGGDSPSITFGNGATLRFMSGGGDDKSRAGFTSRVVVITETDGMDEASATSREADPITQLEGRTKAYGDRARIYLECTVSTEHGRTWQEWTGGSQSRLFIRCPHCAQWVHPERNHLAGWQDAADEIAAGEGARMICPGCGVLWTETDRLEANRSVRLVHRGQEITASGEVTGPRPRTNTLGFRWTCVNNSLVSQGVIAQDEWKAAHQEDERKAEEKEKALCQFAWAMPPKTSIDLSLLNAAAITARIRSEPRGRVPADAEKLTVGVDCGKWFCTFVAIAWRTGCSAHVLDYGVFDVHSDAKDVELALLTALRDFRDGILAQGWQTIAGEKRYASYRLFDAGKYTDTVKKFCAESGAGHFATKGLGDGQARPVKYREVKSTGATVALVGDHYHFARLTDGALLGEIDANHWKTWVHDRLHTPLDAPGALSLYHDSPKAHTKFAKHLLAEQCKDGVWNEISRDNHMFDAAVLASVGGHLAGERLVQSLLPASPTPSQSPPALSFPGITMPDGRPFLVTQRTTRK